MNAKVNQWFAMLFVVLLCATVQAQEKLQKVKIASGGHVIHFLPLDLAAALGYFKDEGLDSEIIYLKGGTATAQALLSKQVDFSTNGIDHALKAAAQGRDDLRMVVLLNQTPGVVLVVDSKYRDKVKTVADLKGMKLGVTSSGSASHMVLAFLLTRNGVELKDVSIVNAGTSTFPPALKNGSIDGGICLEPFASTLIDQGDAFSLQRIITVEESNQALGGPYNLTGILTRKDVIESSPELTRKVVKAHVRALNFIHEHSAEEIAAVLPSEVIGSDRKVYVKTLDSMKGFFSPDGALGLKGAENVLASMKLSGVLDSSVSFSAQDFMDDRFLKSEASLDPLSKQSPTTPNVTSERNSGLNWTLLAIVAIGICAIVGGSVFILRKKK